jgi:hypothetical protein
MHRPGRRWIPRSPHTIFDIGSSPTPVRARLGGAGRHSSNESADVSFRTNRSPQRSCSRGTNHNIRDHSPSQRSYSQSGPAGLLEPLPGRNHGSAKGRGGGSCRSAVGATAASSFVEPPGTGGALLVAFDVVPPPSPLAGTGADAPATSSVVAAVPAPPPEKSTSYGSMRKSRRQIGHKGPSRCRSSHVSMQFEWKQWSHCRLLLQQMVSPIW